MIKVYIFNVSYNLRIYPKVVDVGLLRKILNDPVMLCHERGAVLAPIATRVGGGVVGM